MEQQQPWERPSASGGGPGERTQQPVVPQQYDEVPVPAPRAALLPRFDGTLEAALHAAVPAGRPRFLLLTFGNAAIGPLLRNFALHCRRAGIPHVVGAAAWSKCPPGSAPARLLCLFRARLTALGSSVLPVRGRPTEPASLRLTTQC